jgi:hypothetical protein
MALTPDMVLIYVLYQDYQCSKKELSILEYRIVIIYHLSLKICIKKKNNLDMLEKVSYYELILSLIVN